MMQLRKYQQEAVAAVYGYLQSQRGNPCVVIPTGGGKTPVIAQICKDVSNNGGRVMILSHVKELLEQSRNMLHRFDDQLDIGIYSAGLGVKRTDSRITVAGIQSVYSHAVDFKPFNMIIIDEAHLIPPSGDGMYQTFLKQCQSINANVRLVGMTATPFRTGSGNLCSPDGLLNEVCYTADVKTLIEQGYLSPLVSKNGKHSANFSGLHVRAGEFLEQEVETAVNNQEEIGYAVREIIRLSETRKSVLVFAASIDHAENIQRCLAKQSGMEVGLVTGKTSDDKRCELLRRFRGELIVKNLWGDIEDPLKYLVNVNVLTTGFDAPNIDVVAIMRPTNSPGLYVQMVGRGLRLCDGKKDCLVLDYGENILRHGCIDNVFIRQPGHKGAAPTKVCPKCKEVMHLSTKKCPDCGYTFEIVPKPKNTETASTSHVLSGITETFEVSVFFVIYQRWTKRSDPSSPPTIRVCYSTTIGDVYEWVCPEHTGWAYTRFLKWWSERCKDPGFPSSVDVAVQIANANHLRTPQKLVLEKKSGTRFYNVKKAIFAKETEFSI